MSRKEVVGCPRLCASSMRIGLVDLRLDGCLAYLMSDSSPVIVADWYARHVPSSLFPKYVLLTSPIACLHQSIQSSLILLAPASVPYARLEIQVRPPNIPLVQNFYLIPKRAGICVSPVLLYISYPLLSSPIPYHLFSVQTHLTDGS